MTKWKWLVLKTVRQLWFRATLIGFLGVVAAVLATFAESIPWKFPLEISADAVESVLTIIASSMLAVTTFSVTAMTAAYGSATSNVTPRATRLLIQDRVTHNVLSTFIGAFLFGIVGIVALKVSAYGQQGRALLFFVTVGVIVLIVWALLRWIDHLTRFGRVGNTISQVEDAARLALKARVERPYLGGSPAGADGAPANYQAVAAQAVGYIQFVDIAALAELADKQETAVYLAVLPGTFVYLGEPLVWLDAEDPASCSDEVHQAFSIGVNRDFDQDPRFGLIVLTEIAQRALSPAMNDPGTALDVLHRSARLLSQWARSVNSQKSEVEHPQVYVPRLKDADLLDDAFRLIGRDGAASFEVQCRVQKALHALSHLGSVTFRRAALEQAQLAMKRAEGAMPPEDLQRLHELLAVVKSTRVIATETGVEGGS